MQYTGAYKVRGAYYKISTLSEEEKQRGLITASAGNPCTGRGICGKISRNPGNHRDADTNPLIKINRTKGYGAEVVLAGDVFDEGMRVRL